MSAVNITNVAVLDNPSPFLSPFQFEISYECLATLNDGTISLLSAISASVASLRPSKLAFHEASFFFFFSFAGRANSCDDCWKDSEREGDAGL